MTFERWMSVHKILLSLTHQFSNEKKETKRYINYFANYTREKLVKVTKSSYIDHIIIEQKPETMTLHNANIMTTIGTRATVNHNSY